MYFHFEKHGVAVVCERNVMIGPNPIRITVGKWTMNKPR